MTVGPREQVFLAEEDSRVASLHQNWSCGCNAFWSVEVSVGKEMSIHIKQSFRNTEVSISIEGPNSEI